MGFSHCFRPLTVAWLLQASKARKPSIIRALLAKGADVKAKDSTGSTPLHRCPPAVSLAYVCTADSSAGLPPM